MHQPGHDVTSGTERPISDSPIAAFDFDGTLTRRDTSLPFILYAAGVPTSPRRIIPLLPGFLTDLCAAVWKGMGLQESGASANIRGEWERRMHERLLSRFVGGMRAERLTELGERFASVELERFLIPSRLDRLAWHRARGHQCVLVTASIDAYLRPWGQSVGFDEVIASELEIDEDGAVTGRLLGDYCWGEAKVRKLIARVGPLSGRVLYAYGDSRGDKELLAAAQHAFRV